MLEESLGNLLMGSFCNILEEPFGNMLEEPFQNMLKGKIWHMIWEMKNNSCHVGFLRSNELTSCDVSVGEMF